MAKSRRILSVALATSVAVTGALVGVQPGAAFAGSAGGTSQVAASAEVVITVPDRPGATIDLDAVVPAGEVFSVVLRENPTTGFGWVRAPGDSGPTVTYLDTSYVQDPAPPNMTGVGGTRTFRYQAGAPGSATIGMSYQRPWEGVPLQRVTIDIVVG